MRQRILDEIRRVAAENGGKAPGENRFSKQTAIRINEWRGRFWARWSDALSEAGLTPNQFTERGDPSGLLLKLAEATRHFGHFPTDPERLLFRQVDSEFPWARTLTRHFGGKSEMVSQLRNWVSDRPDFADVLALLPDVTSVKAEFRMNKKAPDGWVYLIKYGPHHKIGRGDELEKRVKQVQIALPDKGELVHAIRTDDPSGIEAYWHRRFADKRANGEWFKLASADIAAFKRRKFQ